MASMLIVGKTLVDPLEYLEKKQLGQIDKLVDSLENNTLETIEFSQGSVSTIDLDPLSGFESDKEKNKFIEIGLGKPLCVEIQTIYTGDYPNGIFGGKKDLMLTSAIKSSVTFDAAARAINKIDKKPSEKSYIEFSAADPGTKIVYYTPAVDSLNTIISFELVADTFNEDAFDQIAKLLQSAAGIPVFMPAAAYLLGGSHVLKLAGNLGNTLLAKKSYLKDSYEVKFNNAGDFDSIARNIVIFNDSDTNAFLDYEAQLLEVHNETKLRLVHKTSKELYMGPAPYLIINLNGQTRLDLAAFTPKLASSALLEKFYGQDDKQGAITQTLEQAMQLYNDMSYKSKAEKMSKILEQMPKDTDEYKKNEALLQAYIKNIQTDDLRPKQG